MKYPTHAQRQERFEWGIAAYKRAPFCMCCGNSFPWPGPQIHEMERKSQAPKRWAELCNYLLVCQPCHRGPLDTMPHVEQLARKLIADPEHFDLEIWLTLRPGQAPRPITIEYVEREAATLEHLRRRFHGRHTG